MPHPEADLSPNAMLSYEDVSVDKMVKRHRLSFLKKNKRTVTHGKIEPQPETLHGAGSLSAFELDGVDASPHRLRDISTSSLRLCKDEGESIHSGSKRDDEETPPTSPDDSEHRQASRVLSRWRRN